MLKTYRKLDDFPRIAAENLAQHTKEYSNLY
jgi:hypothetical protein